VYLKKKEEDSYKYTNSGGFNSHLVEKCLNANGDGDMLHYNEKFL